MVKRGWTSSLLLCAGLVGWTAILGAQGLFVSFDGGIGVLPSATTNPNVVRGINPAGQVWVIDELRAEVRSNGRIRVDGRGLLLGGGNNIGLSNNAFVFATLICGPAPFTYHSTDPAGVQLDAFGDFRIDDQLDSVPAECPSPVLLIRNISGSWFAAGIPKRF